MKDLEDNESNGVREIWYTWGIQDHSEPSLKHLSAKDWIAWRMNHFVTRAYNHEADFTYAIRDYG